jgi:branched-chain amino acid transport system substrate-binding protein
VYAVQGYDTAQLLIEAMNKVQGDTKATKALIEAMKAVRFDNSPRGAWAFSKSNNPVQDVYLRQVKDGDNAVVGIAQKAVADPATGCGIA